MPNPWTGKGNPYTRTEVIARLRDTISKGKPIIAAGAGTGISAKFIERGGADLIIVYNSGRFRMAGHGSTAGMMAYGDANAVAMEIGEYEVLPVVEEIPVICGVHATDPRRRMWHWLGKVKDMGFSGINNFPTHTIIDGKFRQILEETGMSVKKEFETVALARKMDMIPGHPNFIWLESNQPGIYLGQCAEYCGAQHAGMRFRVIAEPPEQFAAWEQAQLAPAPKPATAEAERGAELFRKMTCYNCHNIKGSGLNVQFGPDLTHLASRRSLAADVLENNRENLARWLADPQAIKPGTLMPNYRLTKEQVDDLTTYLETLK